MLPVLILKQPSNHRTENDIGENKKTSVKVHQGPGGNSSFSFGWGNDGVQAPPHQGGRRMYNQPQGQTSSNRNQHNIMETDISSVKVHAPPGGQGNFTLAHHEQEKPQYRQRQAQEPQEDENAPNKFKPSVKVHNPPGIACY